MKRNYEPGDMLLLKYYGSFKYDIQNDKFLLFVSDDNTPVVINSFKIDNVLSYKKSKCYIFRSRYDNYIDSYNHVKNSIYYVDIIGEKVFSNQQLDKIDNFLVFLSNTLKTNIFFV